MKTFRIVINLFFLLLIVFANSSCGNPNGPNNPSEEIYKVNKFIVDGFDMYYLWNKEMPRVDAKKEKDPYALFEKLRYKDDRWSMLTDDVKSLLDSFSGVGTTFGYSLAFYRLSGDKPDVFAVVEYVHANSPAEKAGIKRGDLFLGKDGVGITVDNYLDLIYASAIELEFGKLEDNVLSYTGQKVSLSAVKDYMDPVLLDDVFDTGGKKIGYLVYTDYLLKSHQRLKDVFTKFSQQHIDELILDLRYNSGGYALTSQILSSMIVPKSVLDNREMYLKQVYNQNLTDYFVEQGNPPVDYYAHQYQYADENGKTETVTIDSYLSLSRLFVITGKSTASASEATIAGIKPYLNVVLVGGKTAGKYNGGIVMSPEDLYTKPDMSIANWGMYIMIYRYMNKDGFPEVLGGIEPDVPVEENLLKNSTALGNLSEPLLKAVIGLIQGQALQGAPAAFDNFFVSKFKQLDAQNNKPGGMIELKKEKLSLE
jgi:C-terminal processing protease CtpA/Prc